jgi:2-phosphosulfolactate phosphatase
MTGAARYLARWELDGVDGVVVAIDVIRAFTTAAYAIDAGASCIYLVGEVDEAVELGRSIDGALVMGEDHGRRPDAFDFSNSPVQIAAARDRVVGRPLVQRTSAGTRGVVAATDADRIFAASLVCATATARAVRALGPEPPAYVITGRFDDRPDRPGRDDVLTAELIERARTGEPLDAEATAAAVAASDEAARTLALGVGHVDPDDIAFATRVDRFDFAMEVRRIDGLLQLLRVDPDPEP